jgi:hypothetical protein
MYRGVGKMILKKCTEELGNVFKKIPRNKKRKTERNNVPEYNFLRPEETPKADPSS